MLAAWQTLCARYVSFCSLVGVGFCIQVSVRVFWGSSDSCLFGALLRDLGQRRRSQVVEDYICWGWGLQLQMERRSTGWESVLGALCAWVTPEGGPMCFSDTPGEPYVLQWHSRGTLCALLTLPGNPMCFINTPRFAGSVNKAHRVPRGCH